jgi:hypothetical protein
LDENNSSEMTQQIRLDDTLSKNESKLMIANDESLFEVNLSQLVASQADQSRITTSSEISNVSAVDIEGFKRR